MKTVSVPEKQTLSSGVIHSEGTFTQASVCDELWMRIAQEETPGFFVTAEVKQAGSTFPEAILPFIAERLTAIRQGVTARKFVFRLDEWHIYLTFFPTNQVVDERYALKNKVMKTKINTISLFHPK